MKWMIFYREVDMCYFLYTQRFIVCIQDPSGELLGKIMVDFREELLQEVCDNSRKKGFVHQQARYVVATRGTFLKVP